MSGEQEKTMLKPHISVPWSPVPDWFFSKAESTVIYPLINRKINWWWAARFNDFSIAVIPFVSCITTRMDDIKHITAGILPIFTKILRVSVCQNRVSNRSVEGGQRAYRIGHRVAPSETIESVDGLQPASASIVGCPIEAENAAHMSLRNPLNHQAVSVNPKCFKFQI